MITPDSGQYRRERRYYLIRCRTYRAIGATARLKRLQEDLALLREFYRNGQARRAERSA